MKLANNYRLRKSIFLIADRCDWIHRYDRCGVYSRHDHRTDKQQL